MMLIFEMFPLITILLTLVLFSPLLNQHESEFQGNFFSFICEIFWLKHLKLLFEKSDSVKNLSLFKKKVSLPPKKPF